MLIFNILNIILFLIVIVLLYLLINFLCNKYKNKFNKDLKFFGLNLKNIHGKKKTTEMLIEKGYKLYINNILQGNILEHKTCILKIKTHNTDDFIFVYNGNPYNWNPNVNLTFSDKDKYIIFEYNQNIYLSGFYESYLYN